MEKSYKVVDLKSGDKYTLVDFIAMEQGVFGIVLTDNGIIRALPIQEISVFPKSQLTKSKKSDSEE